MRPEKLSDFVGQEKAVGKGSPLRRMIERDILQSAADYAKAGTVYIRTRQPQFAEGEQTAR